jgi:hypothetical protein
MINIANLSHAPQLDQFPVEVLGIIGAFLPLEDQKRLEGASDQKLSKYSFTIWGDEMKDMPSPSLLKTLQTTGNQFKSNGEQSFYTDRQKHAEHGKKSLLKRDWKKLERDGITKSSVVEHLSEASFEKLDHAVTLREAKKLIRFFNQRVEEINDQDLRELLEAEQTPVQKARELCNWLERSNDKELRAQVDALNLLPRLNDTPLIAYQQAMEYVRRNQHLLTAEDRNELQAQAHIEKDPVTINPEDLNFNQLNVLGLAIERRTSIALIDSLMLLLYRVQVGIRLPLAEILGCGLDPIAITSRLRQEWFSRNDVLLALKQIRPHDVQNYPTPFGRSSNLHLFNLSGNLYDFSDQDSFEAARTLFTINVYHSQRFHQVIESNNPVLIKEILKVNRTYFPIQRSIEGIHKPAERRIVAVKLYETILELVSKKEFSPIWLQDALEIAVYNHLLDRSQMTSLLRKILNENGVSADSLEFIDCVSLLKKNKLLDNKTNALLLYWTLDKKMIDLHEKFIEISPAIDWQKLDHVDLLSLWMQGITTKNCLDELNSRSVDELSNLFADFTQEDKYKAPFETLTSDKLFFQFICNTNNSNPSIAARLRKISIDDLSPLVKEADDHSPTYSQNIHKHLSTFQVAGLALKGTYGSISPKDVLRYLKEEAPVLAKSLSIVALVGSVGLTALAYNSFTNYPQE